MKYIGILVPETNLVVEQELFLLNTTEPKLLKEISWHISRIPVKTDYFNNEMDYLKTVEANQTIAAQQLEFLPIDNFGFFCTSAAAIHGKTTTINQKPCHDPFQALIQASKKLNHKKILLISPYSQATAQLLSESFKQKNLDIIDHVSLNLKSRFDLHNSDNIISKYLKNKKNKPDVIIILCTNFKTFDTIRLIENNYKIPVLSSNQALFWLLLKQIDLHLLSLIKYGKIFNY